MTDAFELRNVRARKRYASFRIWLLAVGLGSLSLITASVVALATRDLDSEQELNAWLLIITGALGVGFVLHQTWRIWPAWSTSLLVMRLDETGPNLRKGRYRDELWFGVPWSSLEAVTFTPLPVPDGADVRLGRLRLLRFVPHPTAEIAEGPPGAFDGLLRLPPRESVLAFVAASAWDDNLRELLDWVRAHLPDLTVEDTVPRDETD